MLYREWFVHFRFPGHEHVKIIDGLPEGWERRDARRCCWSCDCTARPIECNETSEMAVPYPSRSYGYELGFVRRRTTRRA